jgi:hypothetical protein
VDRDRPELAAVAGLLLTAAGLLLTFTGLLAVPRGTIPCTVDVVPGMALMPGVTVLEVA